MRKIIQYYSETKYERSVALCDDGTLWFVNLLGQWEQCPEIPQDSAEPTVINKRADHVIWGNVVDASDSPLIIRIGNCSYRMRGMRVPIKGELYIADNGIAIYVSDGLITDARMIVEEI